LARDSAFREQMEESLLGAKRDIEKAKQKEIEQATQQVLQQHEKEQGAKRKTMLLALSAFLVAIVLGRMIFKRKSRIPNKRKFYRFEMAESKEYQIMHLPHRHGKLLNCHNDLWRTGLGKKCASRRKIRKACGSFDRKGIQC
jgi:hypothetical protein